jgi:hypothetical protein
MPHKWQFLRLGKYSPLLHRVFLLSDLLAMRIAQPFIGCSDLKRERDA